VIFLICLISVLCIVTGVIFCKPHLGLVFVIVCLPFEGKIESDCVTFYPLEAILTIFVFICIYKYIVGAQCFKNMWLVYCCIPFVLCILLSSIKSKEFSLTVKEAVRWLELFLIYYLTINLINNERKMKIILYSMVLTLAIVSICGIINYLGDPLTAQLERRRASSFFGNANVLVGYVNLIIPVLFGMLITSRCLWEKVTLSAFTVLAVSIFIFTFSRSGWISLTLAMIVVFFLVQTKKRSIFFLAMFFTIFVIAIISLITKDNFIYRLLLTRNYLERIIMNHLIGYDMLRGNLFFGIGVGNYPLLIQEYTDRSVLILTNLHSLYLQVFVETGIIGLCAFAFWLVCIIKYLIAALVYLAKPEKYNLFIGLMGGVIVYLINNFANVLTVHGIHLQWGIILGLAVVLTQFRESETCPVTV
jgi:O-antigen ligase